MPPLIVDLDGTLIAADVLYEGLKRAARRRPWALAGALGLLAFGRAPFKAAVARIAGLDAAGLPYREGFLGYLRVQKAQGRRLALATAADRATAEAVAAHLGLFEAVLASEGRVNLKDARKRDAIRDRYGDRFVYAGDSTADLAIWRAAAGIVLVGAAPALARRARALEVPIEAEFDIGAPRRSPW